MRKLIGAIVAMGVVVTTVAFVRQREAVSRRRPERKAVRVTMSRFRAYGDCTFGSGIRFRKTNRSRLPSDYRELHRVPTATRELKRG